jgi:hypothetical protein
MDLVIDTKKRRDRGEKSRLVGAESTLGSIHRTQVQSIDGRP